MTEARVFFPRDTLDTWLNDESVDLERDRLTLKSTGQTYRLTEALRILREVSGAGDAEALEGKVKTVAGVRELGAEILGGSMVLGERAYEVVFGWLGALEAAREAAREANNATPGSNDSPQSADAALLARFMLSALNDGPKR